MEGTKKAPTKPTTKVGFLKSKENTVCLTQEQYDDMVRENAYLKGYQDGKEGKPKADVVSKKDDTVGYSKK